MAVFLVKLGRDENSKLRSGEEVTLEFSDKCVARLSGTYGVAEFNLPDRDGTEEPKVYADGAFLRYGSWSNEDGVRVTLRDLETQGAFDDAG